MSNKKHIKGVRLLYIFIPTMVLIGITFAVIIVSTILTNRYSEKLSIEIQESTECVNDVTKILGTSSKLADTSNGFIDKPLSDEDSLIPGPLLAYVETIQDTSSKPNVIKETLKKYNLSNEIQESIDKALKNYEHVIEVQKHAYTLIYNDIINVVDLKESEKYILDNSMNVIGFTTLDDEERNYSTAEFYINANKMINNDDYAKSKSEVSHSVNSATSTILEESKVTQNNTSSTLRALRYTLWLSILFIILTTGVFFVLLFKQLLLPIVRYGKLIEENKSLDNKTLLYEPNFLATSYNELLIRHEEFENELRRVAEYDSLTALPNRYCYNEFLKNNKAGNYPTCAFLFDINNLKIVNDTLGHSEGDVLIKNSALCIKEVFLKDDDKNCYRIGGDEFVAICDNIKEDEIIKLVERFKKIQKDFEVSIAIGYAYTDDISKIGYEKLIMQADENMYSNKKNMKKA